jgi:major membrane immunogen (membrane-anchored lipoprotein)
MKKVLSFTITTLFLLAACSKQEVKFETLSSEAFAYDIGDGTSEVNASVRVKGFTQNEKNGEYSSSISFTVDLQRPDSSIVKSIFHDVHKESDHEPINDVGLESQFDLDSTYTEGNYKLIYNITDDISKNKLTATVSFDISK